MKDPVVEEVRKIRGKIAAKCKHNLDAIFTLCREHAQKAKEAKAASGKKRKRA